MHTYGTAQWQLDTHTRVNGEKCAGKLTEYVPNLHGCPSCFKSVTVMLIPWRLPRYKALSNSYYSAKEAQYRLFILAAWI